MSRYLIALALAATTSAARAQPAPGQPPQPASPASPASPAAPAPDDAEPGDALPDDAPGPDGQPQPTPDGVSPAPTGPAVRAPDEDVTDQGISAAIGLATGGRSTPGGLRIAGHYLYQLSADDWFDGAASFTFGSGGTACFRDRADDLVCEHGIADGAGVEISASIRRWFAPQGAFRPFARLGVGLGLVRFGDDDVTGFTVPAHAGGGIRLQAASAVAVVVDADLALGFGSFTRGLGNELQFSFAVTAGAEFRLR
jgi:opacity protein-like surface antigen